MSAEMFGMLWDRAYDAYLRLCILDRLNDAVAMWQRFHNWMECHHVHS